MTILDHCEYERIGNIFNYAPEQREARLAEIAALQALYKIRRIPVMPFPDRSAHSEKAFANAVWRAWSDIQQTADEALAALERSLNGK